MCRLFGFRSNVVSRAHRSLIEAENAVEMQAEQHGDGWGIGYYLDGEPYMFRAPQGAAGDQLFRALSVRLQSQTFLVHLRRATVGIIDTLNTHPFRYGSWMFAHNGTVFSFDKFRDRMLNDIEPQFKHLIFGTTDSEHYFYFLLSHLVRAGCDSKGRLPFDIDAAVEAQHLAITKIFQWAKDAHVDPPKANYILTNGTMMFARRAGLELYLATQKKICPDVDVCTEPNKVCLSGIMPTLSSQKRARKCNHLLVASEPISSEDIWEEIPDGSMISLDADFRLRVHPKPDEFWVTWPPEVTKHPVRPDVIPA